MAASKPRLDLYSVHFNDPKNKYIDLDLCHTSIEEFTKRCELHRPIESIEFNEYKNLDCYLTPANDKDFYRVYSYHSRSFHLVTLHDVNNTKLYDICMGLVKLNAGNMEYLPESMRFHAKFLHDAVVANNAIELTDAQNVLLAQYRKANGIQPVDYYHVTLVINDGTYYREKWHTSLSDFVIDSVYWTFQSLVIHKICTRYHLAFNFIYHATNSIYDKYHKPNKYVPVTSPKRVDVTTPENVKLVLEATIKHKLDGCTDNKRKFIENALERLTKPKPVPTLPEPDPLTKHAEELQQKLEQFLTKVDLECGDLDQLYTSFHNIPTKYQTSEYIITCDIKKTVGNVFTYNCLAKDILEPAVPVVCPLSCLERQPDKSYISSFTVCYINQKKTWSKEMQVAMFIHWLWNNKRERCCACTIILLEYQDVLMVLASVLGLTDQLLDSIAISPVANRISGWDATKLMIKDSKAFGVIYNSTMSK